MNDQDIRQAVMFAAHGYEGPSDPETSELASLRKLLRACQNPGAFKALKGDGDADDTREVIQGAADLYRRLAHVAGCRTDIYDSENPGVWDDE